MTGQFDTSEADLHTLDCSLVKGIAWTGSMKWITMLITWASTLLVARILTPEDYGLVTMASIYLALVGMANEFGLGAAVITNRDLTDKQISQVNALAVLIGITFFSISCLASKPLAFFFGAPRLQWVLIAMSAAFVINGFQSVPNALLQKDMQFKLLALIEGCQSTIQALTMVTLCLLGFGYWTLVCAGLAGTVASCLLTCACRPHPFTWPQVQDIKKTLTFSRHFLVNQISWYLFSNGDFWVVGRVLGDAALGAYTFGWTMAHEPHQKISALVNRVTYSFFSTLQKDQAVLRRYLLNLSETVVLLTFPLTLGMSLVAEEFVLLALGAKWQAAIQPFQLLSIHAAVGSALTLLPVVLFVSGQARFAMWNSVMAALILPLSFYLGTRWGNVGVAATWIVVHPIVSLPAYWRIFRTVNLSLTEYLQSLWPALSGCAIMVPAVLALKLWVVESWSLSARLTLEVIVGGVAYALTLIIFHRARLHAFYKFLQGMRR